MSSKTISLGPLALVWLMGGSTLMAANQDRILFDFEKPDAVRQWQTVNDGVMGGVSDGRIKINDGKKMEFYGTLSLTICPARLHSSHGKEEGQAAIGTEPSIGEARPTTTVSGWKTRTRRLNVACGIAAAGCSQREYRFLLEYGLVTSVALHGILDRFWKGGP